MVKISRGTHVAGQGGVQRRGGSSLLAFGAWRFLRGPGPRVLLGPVRKDKKTIDLVDPKSASASAQAKPRTTLRPCRSISPVTPEMYYFIAFSPNNPPGGGFSALSDGARGFFFPDIIIAHPENLSRGLYKILDEIFLFSRKVCRNFAGKSWGLWKCVPGNS